MSLSFVSKSVQTTTDDGVFEEKPIEGADQSGDSGGNAEAKPLFEQLRANQEKHDLEHEEMQRSIMRGTLALDEEDAAHLQAIGKQRQMEDQRRKQQVNADLAAFRAAKADRYEQQHSSTGPPDGDEVEAIAKEISSRRQPSSKSESKPSVAKLVVPKIVAKRKRKPVLAKVDSKKTKPYGPGEEKAKDESKNVAVGAVGGTSGLGSLMAGYGSESSESSDS